MINRMFHWLKARFNRKAKDRKGGFNADNPFLIL